MKKLILFLFLIGPLWARAQSTPLYQLPVGTKIEAINWGLQIPANSLTAFINTLQGTNESCSITLTSASAGARQISSGQILKVTSNPVATPAGYSFRVNNDAVDFIACTAGITTIEQFRYLLHPYFWLILPGAKNL